ncbi:tetratricopeptide repeat protein [Craterilacuibacter sinensis]|uniref:Tetratricopeptide repeat protein n=1 Tax=Craterilacuibacter sinensis TaxID=2686017 RepID=A0A845BG94_9NEIS|nr:tetratricopeptide repeat protein [Craterilacuibacter sinensis]MXR35767.1 tetratricopeptide repeat protein [Craterilacuibacter sinensis]
MTRLLRLLWLSLLLSIALPATAEAVSRDDFAANKELLQLKLDSQRELAQKDAEAVKARIDALEKRIDEQNNRVTDIGQGIDRFSVIIGIASILVTLLLTAGGFIGGFSVAQKAKREAREEAQKESGKIAEQASQEWFKNNNNTLLETIEELKLKAKQAHGNIDDEVDGVKQHSSQAMAEIQKNMGDSKIGTPRISAQEKEALKQDAEHIREKPEASYSFDDWNTRAFDAYNTEKYEDAAQYWKHASCIPNAGAGNTAQALLNRALTLNHLRRNDEACATYRELIDRYSLDNTPAIREQVAKAMANMAVTLEKMQKPDELISICKRLIENYSSDDTPTIRKQVAHAFNGIGFTLLMQAKQSWQDKTQTLTILNTAKENLLKSLQLNENEGSALSNLAYVQWLLDERAAAEKSFRTALDSPNNGGKNLYKDTLTDIDQHPIAEDADFRAMVERLWNEHQQQSTSQTHTPTLAQEEATATL